MTCRRIGSRLLDFEGLPLFFFNGERYVRGLGNVRRAVVISIEVIRLLYVLASAFYHSCF